MYHISYSYKMSRIFNNNRYVNFQSYVYELFNCGHIYYEFSRDNIIFIFTVLTLGATTISLPKYHILGNSQITLPLTAHPYAYCAANAITARHSA